MPERNFVYCLIGEPNNTETKVILEHYPSKDGYGNSAYHAPNFDQLRKFLEEGNRASIYYALEVHSDIDSLLAYANALADLIRKFDSYEHDPTPRVDFNVVTPEKMKGEIQVPTDDISIAFVRRTLEHDEGILPKGTTVQHLNGIPEKGVVFQPVMPNRALSELAPEIQPNP